MVTYKSYQRLILWFIGVLFVSGSSSFLWSKQPLLIYVFRNFKSEPPQRMMLVGEIKSKTKEALSSEKEPLEEYDARKDRVTVKLFDRKGLKVGQKVIYYR